MARMKDYGLPADLAGSPYKIKPATHKKTTRKAKRGTPRGKGRRARLGV